MNQICIKAIEVLETEGWIQGKLRTTEGCCLAGALLVAAGKDKDGFEDAKKLVKEQINGEVIGFWNDLPERTKEEVIEILRKAAES